MRIIIGSLVLVFGISVLGRTLTSIPHGADTAFLVGSFLLPTVIIILGVVILMWKGKRNPE